MKRPVTIRGQLHAAHIEQLPKLNWRGRGAAQYRAFVPGIPGNGYGDTIEEACDAVQHAAGLEAIYNKTDYEPDIVPVHGDDDADDAQAAA